jgi:hypothetical protein
MAATADAEEVRVRSKRLFGHSYMLEICAALNDVTDRTTLTQLLGESSLSPSVYAGVLTRLRAVGLLVPDPRPDDDHRERWFRPEPSGLWAAAAELTR